MLLLSRRRFFALAALPLATLPLTGAARAGQISAYTQKAFDDAQAAGKPILLEISATWCPTCQAQKPIIHDLSASASFKDLVVLDVDFDSQKDIVSAFGANMQSTLIVFKGKTEVDRTVGVTDPAAIEASLTKALPQS
jgi:thioredoxin 1